MRDQNVRLLVHEIVVDGRKDRRTVPSRKTAAPDVHLGRAPDEVRRTEVVGLFVGHPDLSAENAAQPRDSQSRHRGDASVQIVRSQGAAPEIVEIIVRVGVVIPGNPPDVGERHRFAQEFLERSARLRVAENHHGVGLVEAGRLVDVGELTVRVAAKENVRKLFGTMLTPTSPPAFRSLLLLVTHDSSFFPRAKAPQAPGPSLSGGAGTPCEGARQNPPRGQTRGRGGLGLPFQRHDRCASRRSLSFGARGISLRPREPSGRTNTVVDGVKWLRKAHHMRRQWEAL